MKISTEQKASALALSFLEGIGPIRAKKLIEFFGSPKAVWEASQEDLLEIPGMTPSIAQQFENESFLLKADSEIEWAEQSGILVHYYQDSAYPWRMQQVEDGPLLLFQKGHTNLNPKRTLAVVGTRTNSQYGRRFLQKFTSEISAFAPLLFSGLAYGIDALAHRNAVEQGLPNIAVLAHGFDRIYPSTNRRLAEDILDVGGSWISEFPRGTNPDRENFPKRNRLIAACSDAVLVVEAARKGGALITADLANGYNKDVFCLPGRFDDPMSAGCNKLIRSQQAHLIESARDIAYIMSWEESAAGSQSPQLQIFPKLDKAEQKLLDALRSFGKAQSLDSLQLKLALPPSSILGLLLSLELKSVVETLPGPLYRLKS